MRATEPAPGDPLMHPPGRITLSPDLLPRLRAREESAYRELFDYLAPSLVHFAAQKLRSAEAAEDIVQDILYRIWEQGPRFSPRGTVVSYLFTAVRNQVLNTLRHDRIVRGSHASGLGG